MSQTLLKKYINGKPVAIIYNWDLIEGTKGYYLMGTIKRHPRQDQFHSDIQSTSPIVEMDLEAGWAETENTHYELADE